MEKNFENATRAGLRFETPQGALSVEDLWHLPLTSRTGRANLDDIARGLHKQLKDTDENVSFVDNTKKTDTKAQLAFEIVKHIITVRLSERDEAAQAAERAERKQVLLGLLADKSNEELKGLSADELRAKIAAL
jgi:hypothetical protein